MTKARRRGRPRTLKPEIDLGTEELQRKRKQNLTTEPLDLCLSRHFITQEQHMAGVHFRWLHNVRYGVVGVHAMDPTNLGGMGSQPRESEWYRRREQEYLRVTQNISRFGLDRLLVCLCIHNEPPHFLKYRNYKSLPMRDLMQLRKTRRALNLLSNSFSGRHTNFNMNIFLLLGANINCLC